MTAHLMKSGTAVVFDEGMTWPSPGRHAGELNWRFRYAPESITRSDMLAAASIISASIAFFCQTQRMTRLVISGVTEAVADSEGCPP